MAVSLHGAASLEPHVVSGDVCYAGRQIWRWNDKSDLSCPTLCVLGGAFLVAYFLCLGLVAAPLYFAELSLGQLLNVRCASLQCPEIERLERRPGPRRRLATCTGAGMVVKCAGGCSDDALQG